MEVIYISITRMAKERGKQTAEMFEFFIDNGLITSVDGERKWELTEKGKIKGGRYRESPGFREYIEWPYDLQIENSSTQINVNSLSGNKQFGKSQVIANTEGEKFIKEFFRDTGIKCVLQEPIRNLSHDIKAHRVADFYLPKYKTYVEFFGHWNTSPEHRENYNIKKKVYQQNLVPCVILYPENLGFIYFAFDHRLIETLKENHKEESLSKYYKWKFFRGAKDNFIGLAICIIIYLLMIAAKEPGKALLILLFFYNIYKIIKISFLIYVKGSYSLARMLSN